MHGWPDLEDIRWTGRVSKIGTKRNTQISALIIILSKLLRLLLKQLLAQKTLRIDAPLYCVTEVLKIGSVQHDVTPCDVGV